MKILSKLAKLIGMSAAEDDKAVKQEASSARQRTALLDEFRAKGEAAMDKGYFSDAEKWIRQAVSLAPDDEKACLYLGIVLAQKNQEIEAVKYFERALATNPGSFAASLNLSMATLTLGRYDEAEVHCRAALRCEPENTLALMRLGAILKEQWRILDSIAAHRQATDLLPASLEARTSLLWMQQYDDSPSQADIFEEHRRYGAEIARQVPVRKDVFANRCADAAGSRRLKIGYVSADFRAHSVSLFMLPLLEQHDKSRFEVHCYSTFAGSDSMTLMISKAAEHFIECANLSNAQLVDRIIADEIDVLVDLGGHTVGSRLPVFAEKPAPVQMTCLGYVDTTGMSSMDYRLTCVDADPAENDAFHTEKLYRLKNHLHFVFRPEPGMPELTAQPALRRGYVTLLSNNQIEKITPKIITTWAKILKLLPESRMVIMAVSGDHARAKIIEAFRAEGIDEQRLTLHGRVLLDEFRQLVMDTDLALDTYPFNGATTTCETLCVGVPVITLRGQRFASRVGFAILNQIGLGHFAASNFDDYVATAVRAAQDVNSLAALRSQLRARVEASPLRDESGFARDLEDAYYSMVSEWRAGCAAQTAGNPKIEFAPLITS